MQCHTIKLRKELFKYLQELKTIAIIPVDEID